MRVADALRHALVRRRESFVFETVFSDPVGAKLAFLKDAASAGYTVVVCYVGLASARFPRTLANLRAVIREIDHMLIFDNSDLRRPFQMIAVFHHGRRADATTPLPEWLGLELNSARSVIGTLHARSLRLQPGARGVS